MDYRGLLIVAVIGAGGAGFLSATSCSGPDPASVTFADPRPTSTIGTGTSGTSGTLPVGDGGGTGDGGGEGGVVGGGRGGGLLPGQRAGAEAEAERGQRQEGLVDHLGGCGSRFRACRAADARSACRR